MNGAGVSLAGLGRSFGEVDAVEGLTLNVESGSLFGIVGPDGAGKTTTLRMLAGVLRPSRGRAWIGGIDVGADPERAKPFLAYMAQRFGLYDDLTVIENLRFYADLYGVPHGDRPARLERLFAFSGLGDFRSRLAGRLSGGMKQKLALSCCLVHRPAVLLLDEPTFGVDPISRRDLWLIVHEMVAEGVTAIVTTSYLDEAERCDRVALLNEGRLLAMDTPPSLQASLEGTLFAVRTSQPREARDVLRSARGVVSASLFGERLHVLVQPELGERAWSEPLRSRGIDVLVFDEIDPSLEDVFIHLVTQPGRGDA